MTWLSTSETGATLGFDATGGGKLASQILTAMEVANKTATNIVGMDQISLNKSIFMGDYMVLQLLLDLLDSHGAWVDGYYHLLLERLVKKGLVN